MNLYFQFPPLLSFKTQSLLFVLFVYSLVKQTYYLSKICTILMNMLGNLNCFPTDQNPFNYRQPFLQFYGNSLNPLSFSDLIES